MDTNAFTLSATGVTAVVAFLPVLVTGFLTTRNVSGALKGFMTLALNAIVGAVTTATLADGTAVVSWQSVFSMLVGFAMSVAYYKGILKPAKITSSDVVVTSPDGTVRTEPGALAHVGVK